MTDSTEFKRRQRAALQAERESNYRSILAGFAQDAADTPDQPELDTKPKLLRPCQSCKGTGYNQGIFQRYECGECLGTRFDLSDPLSVIKGLIDGGEKLRKQYNALRRELESFTAMWTEKEIDTRREHVHAEKHRSRFD